MDCSRRFMAPLDRSPTASPLAGWAWSSYASCPYPAGLAPVAPRHVGLLKARAEIGKWASVASRVVRHADGPSMSNHVDVERTPQFSGNCSLQIELEPPTRLRTGQRPSQPPGHSPHMRIDRENSTAKRVEHHAERRLARYARKAHEVVIRRLVVIPLQEVERWASCVLDDACESGLQLPRLLSIETTSSDRRLDLFERCVREAMPAGESTSERFERSKVEVLLGLGRQDDEHQFVQRSRPVMVRRGSVDPEATVNLYDDALIDGMGGAAARCHGVKCIGGRLRACCQ